MITENRMHNRTSFDFSDISQQTVRQIVPVVCSVLQQSTYQLPPPKRKRPNAMEEDEMNKETDIDMKLKVRLIILCILFKLNMYFRGLKGFSIVFIKYSTCISVANHNSQHNRRNCSIATRR